MKQFLTIFSALFILFSVFSCKKVETFEVELTVIDFATKQPKANVEVKSTALTSTPNKPLLSDVEQTKFSNGDGKVSFKFDEEAKIHFELVLENEKKFASTDIKLMPNEVVKKTVLLYKGN
jgi:hypothetical protein